MKSIKLILSMCFICIISIQTISAQDSKKDKKEEIAQQVRKAIDSNHYKLEIDRMIPMSGPSKDLTSEYSIEIKNDSVFSRLPYFGRAYNIPYGGGNGLIFNAPLNEYIAQYHKKGKVEIKFVTRSEEDKFTFHITIFPNASASVNVNSTNRQPISYYGKLSVD